MLEWVLCGIAVGVFQVLKVYLAEGVNCKQSLIKHCKGLSF